MEKYTIGSFLYTLTDVSNFALMGVFPSVYACHVYLLVYEVKLCNENPMQTAEP